jgi:hypothetical protein
MDNLQASQYYIMTVKDGCRIQYMYTGDDAEEGTYCIQVRGLIKKNGLLHTVVASVVPYTGKQSDIVPNPFFNYENVVSIYVLDKVPHFARPSLSFYKIIRPSWNPCRPPLPKNY